MATAALSILQFYQNSENCDVVFNVRFGSTWCSFPAHRLVLSIWSPVLASQLQLNKSNPDKEVDIEDIRPSTFQAFLNYLYTQEVERNEGIKFVLELHAVAKKFNVQRLKTHCCEILESSSPNATNIFYLLETAILINSDCLKGRCYRVLQCETDAILYLQDIQAIKPSTVMTILQLPSLWLTSEYELLSWVFKWARSLISNQQNAYEPKEIISQFLPYLNFTALKSRQFATLVDDYKEFFDEVDCFKIFMNINVPGSMGLPNWHDSSRNSRRYSKPTTPALIGDFDEELGYVENNLDDNSNDKLVIGSNPANINSVDTSDPNICCKSLIQTVEKAIQTEIALDIRNGRKNSSLSLNEGYPVSSSIHPMDINNRMQLAEAVGSNYEGSIFLNGKPDGRNKTNNSFTPLTEIIPLTTSEPSIEVNYKMQSTETVVEESIFSESSVPTDSRISDTPSFSKIDENTSGKSSVPTDDKISNSRSFSTVDKNKIRKSEMTDPKIVESTVPNNPAKLDERSSTVEDLSSSLVEAIERGQNNAEKLDLESESSWEFLEPSRHRQKIKKKKIKSMYLLPKEKSLPNVGVWESELGPKFLSCDFKSLSAIIEKQQSLPIAAEILSRSYIFENGPPCIFEI